MSFYDLGACELTHWGQDKMAAILQTTYSYSYIVLKVWCFDPDYWNLFPRNQVTIFEHCLNNGLTPTRRQAFILANDDVIYWCIYASLDLTELTVHTMLQLVQAHCINSTIFISSHLVWRNLFAFTDVIVSQNAIHYRNKQLLAIAWHGVSILYDIHCYWWWYSRPVAPFTNMI